MTRNSTRRMGWMARFAALALTAAVMLVKPSLLFAAIHESGSGSDGVGCTEMINWLTGQQNPG